MSNQHTPGPWRIRKSTEQGTQIVSANKIIGVTWTSPLGDKAFPSYDEARANARLIAAAPELLTAAKWILRSAGYENGKARPVLQELTVGVSYLDYLRATITKAEKKGVSDA